MIEGLLIPCHLKTVFHPSVYYINAIHTTLNDICCLPTSNLYSNANIIDWIFLCSMSLKKSYLISTEANPSLKSCQRNSKDCTKLPHYILNKNWFFTIKVSRSYDQLLKSNIYSYTKLKKRTLLSLSSQSCFSIYTMIVQLDQYIYTIC